MDTISPASLSFELVSASSDAVIVTNADGRILLWNAAAATLFGYPASEAIGRPLDFIIPPAMRGEHTAGMKRLCGGGAPRLVGKPVEVPALRADGSTVPIELLITRWNDGAAYFGATIREMSGRRENEKLLHSLAHFDQLTMLPNRHRFLASLHDALQVEKPPLATVLLVNLDRFAEVNDRLGAGEADDLLRETALILKRFVGSFGADENAVGRTGANEFAMVIPGGGDAGRAMDIAGELKAALAALRGSDARAVTASIGVSVAPIHGETSDRLIANADFALRQAKLDGGDAWRLFQPRQREIVRARRELSQALRSAWATRQFEVYFQPQVRLSDGLIVGAEALLRWRHPARGVVLPAHFIEALADLELAEQVGDFVVEEACLQAAAWRDLAGRPIKVGVNLFERQFMRADQPERVVRALEAARLAPDCLELEIIETTMTSSDDEAIRRVQRLRDVGVGIAFDDYGTGYASLGLLKRYPITTLKIDRAFVKDIAADEGDRTIVELVLTLGRRFGFRVVAEGVETEQDAEVLRALGCEEAQGYLYGRPAPAASISAVLRAGRRGRSGVLVA